MYVISLFGVGAHGKHVPVTHTRPVPLFIQPLPLSRRPLDSAVLPSYSCRNLYVHVHVHQGCRNRTGRTGHGRPTFSAIFFSTLQQSAMISAQTWQILVPDRGLLQNQKSMYTEMAPNAWECLQLASIFDFFPGEGNVCPRS